MIEKQREKEFLFELELLYHNYNLIVESDGGFGIELEDADRGDIDETTKVIQRAVDELRVETIFDAGR